MNLLGLEIYTFSLIIVLLTVQYAMPQDVRLAKQIIIYSTKCVLLLAHRTDIIYQDILASYAIALATLVLEEPILIVSLVQLLSSFSLRTDVWLAVQMDSQKMLPILAIHAQNFLHQAANLATTLHARHVLLFRYPIIQVNVCFAILLATTLVASVDVEMLKIVG